MKKKKRNKDGKRGMKRRKYRLCAIDHGIPGVNFH